MMNERLLLSLCCLVGFSVAGCGSDGASSTQEQGEDEGSATFLGNPKADNLDVLNQRAVLALVNHASQEELDDEVGIWASTAKRIVETREQQGEYKSAKALDDVRGVGPSTYKTLQNYALENGYKPHWPEGLQPELKTLGEQVTGEIASHETVRFPLQVSAQDEVLFTLSVASGESWSPGLALFPSGGTRRFAWNTPKSGEAGTLPWDSKGNGFVFREDQLVELEVSNASNIPGKLSLTVVCLSGPCKEVVEPDPEPDPDPDPKPSDDTLKQELIKEYYTGHIKLDYATSRLHLFTEIYKDAEGNVECVYTGEKFPVGEKIPDHMVINTEHVWPKSRGAEFEPEKSDLHHLLPTQSQSNTKRDSWHYGVVTRSVEWEQGGSKLGESDSEEVVFEPRDETKGNVARASFYFSVMYNKRIKPSEEAVLRAWHIADPVDADELRRNTLIQKHQNSRNPFVEKPELVEQLKDF